VRVSVRLGKYSLLFQYVYFCGFVRACLGVRASVPAYVTW